MAQSWSEWAKSGICSVTPAACAAYEVSTGEDAITGEKTGDDVNPSDPDACSRETIAGRLGVCEVKELLEGAAPILVPAAGAAALVGGALLIGTAGLTVVVLADATGVSSAMGAVGRRFARIVG